MKSNRAFVVIIIALMAVMILFEMNAPTRFQWDDTSQSYKSKHPFGCYVMDSVLRASLPQGYEVCGTDIDKYIGKKSRGGTHTYLFTNNYVDFLSSFDVDFLTLIKGGNNVILAFDENSYYYGATYVRDELEFSMYSFDYNNMGHNYYKKVLSDRTYYDTIRWRGDGKFAAGSYVINHAFCGYALSLSQSYRTLATLRRANGPTYVLSEESTTTIAGIRTYGNGKVVVVSMPLLFTNYGILNDTIRPLVLRLLSECGDKPVVRYDQTLINWDIDNEDSEQEEGSPLHYLLANRPLRWAFYLALATLVAFVFFSARRRQRVIPVVKPPVNHMMDFVKQIGGIYYKHHDNVDLLAKKYATFSNEVRTKAMIDIDNNDQIDDELLALSNRTGIPLNELQQHISDVKNAIQATSISDKRLQQLIDVMNDIMHRINI